MGPIIETRRLRLYPADDETMKELVEREQDPDLKQAYAEMLAGCVNDPEHRIWYAVWFISPPDEPDRIAGDLSFKGPAADGAVELGYGLREGYCGKGYMTEAVKAITEWALRQKGVTRVEAETAPENAASQMVLARAGFLPTSETGEEGPRYVYGIPQKK